MVGYLNVWLWLQFVKVSKNNAKRSGGNILVSHCIHQHYGLSINQSISMNLLWPPHPKLRGARNTMKMQQHHSVTGLGCWSLKTI